MSFERQETLGVNRDQTVLVVGCGGIGSWAAYFLGLGGVKKIHLFDSDTVSETNLNRLPLGRSALGKNKAEAVADLINGLGNGCEAVAHSNIVSVDIIDLIFPWFGAACPDWMVVSTDSLKSRREALAVAKNWGIDYIECGAEGHTATVTGIPGDWETPDEQNPGYASVPVFVVPCTLAASIASYYVLLNKEPNQTYRASWNDAGLKIQTFKES